MKRLHLRDALCACVLLFVFSHTTFAATVQYQYTGNVFDTNDPADPLCVIGATGCFSNITATVELPTVLAANLILGNPVVWNSWSISDGLTTIDDQTPGFNYSLSFGTNASGNITGWSFGVSAVTQALDQLSSMRTTTSIDDTRYCATFDTSTSSCTANAIAEANTAGSWAPPTTVPIPATVWLFGSGLLGLIGLSRRRQTKTLPAPR
jgi:hypothetical protein